MVTPVELTLPATPIAPALARAGLELVCDGIPMEAGDDLRLIVSEVVATTIGHAEASDDHEITVRAVPNDVGVHVEVTGAGPGFDTSTFSDTDDTGWGAYIMRRLASDWGVVQRDAYTTVWFDVAA